MLLATGLIFAFLGVGTVLGGFLGPRVIGRTNSKRAIVIGFIVQGAATLPLAFVSESSAWVIPLLIVSFIGGAANLVAIVGCTVTSTAGVPAKEQGLATGLITMSQQVGITLGTPVLSAIVTAFAGATLLPGIQASIGIDAALCIAGAILAGLLLRLPAAPADPREG